MPPPRRPPWPHGKKAAISITLDNMGEAADLHRGLWPASAALGSHFSTTTTLPRMLSILSQHSVRATYFIEAWNLDVYPGVIKTLQEAGHEIGFHAWQHEVWARLDAATETGNLEMSLEAAERVGVRYVGFRPPGGLVTERTLGLMRGCGMRYLSPAAERVAVVEGVAVVPFQWEGIDAYFYMEGTKGLRVSKGDGEGVMGEEVVRERLMRRVDRVVEEGGYLALLFHPFLQTSEERMRVLEEVVEYVASKREEVWIAQCKDVGDWVLEHREAFGDDPGWDRAEWKKN